MVYPHTQLRFFVYRVQKTMYGHSWTTNTHNCLVKRGRTKEHSMVYPKILHTRWKYKFLELIEILSPMMRNVSSYPCCDALGTSFIIKRQLYPLQMLSCFNTKRMAFPISMKMPSKYITTTIIYFCFVIVFFNIPHKLSIWCTQILILTCFLTGLQN
jgi:hypothetical protein